jgi:methionine biosynthesis protein MetW
MRTCLSVYGANDRHVWVADSFEGLPVPDPAKYQADAGDKHHTYDELRVSLDEVKKNFVRYGLLDANDLKAMSSMAAFDDKPDAYVQDFLGYVPASERYNTENIDPYEAGVLIASLVPSGARVLDVGCGTGFNSSLVRQQRNADVVCIEPEPERAEAARKRGLPVHQGYLTNKLGETLGKFDVVLFVDVLEHLANPGHLIRVAAKALCDDGRLVISVPNAAHWSVRASLLFGRFEYDQCGIMDATHLRWYTRSSLDGFLRNVGFRIEKQKYTAGTTLPVYSRNMICRMMSRNLRDKIVKRLSQSVPTLFACQFVVSAGRANALPLCETG